MDSKTFLLKIKDTPPSIRTWFASGEVSLMVRTINQHFNIQKGSETVLPKLLARLEVRDIAPDYFAGELSEELKLDRDKALGISTEVKRTILTPLTKEFLAFGVDISLLDKFQIPTIKDLSPSATMAIVNGPKIIQDVSITPPKPVALPAVGWSKMPASTFSSTPTPVPPVTPRPITPLAPIAPAAPAEPAPIILHEDTAFKAVEKNAGFTLARPGGGADMQLGGHGSSSVPTPPRPAVLEFGGAKPAAPMPSAVHNTGQSVPLSAMPTANTGPRSVSQITPVAAIPTPPKPPAPPMSPAPSNIVPMPQPPQPPSAPQSAKPIVKDFL